MPGSCRTFRAYFLALTFLCLIGSGRAIGQEAPPPPDAVEVHNGSNEQFTMPATGQIVVDGQAGSGEAVEVKKPTDVKKYSLSGSVVNSVTGEGIPRALVEMNNQLATMTDSSGNFRFEGLAAGSYYLSPRKPGYFERDESSNPMMMARVAAMTEVGPDTPAVSLKLIPESVIFGHVTDSDGLPVQRLPVQGMRLTIADGRRQWQPVSTGSTDEDGHYRISNLATGTYVVVAGPSQFPSIGAMAKTAHENAGYAAVFYPAPAEDGSTAGVKLSAGQKLEADLSAEAEPFYTVSGTLIAPPGGGGWLRLVPRGNARIERGGAMLHRETGTFKIRMAQAGDYVVEAGAQFEGRTWTASAPLHVSSNITDLQVVLEPSVVIPVATRVEKSATTSLPTVGVIALGGRRTPVQVNLRATDQRRGVQQQFTAAIRLPNDESSFAFDNVPPGTYTIDFNPTEDLYVASAKYGSVDLLSENLVVTQSANQDPIEIVLRDDGGRLKGSITDNGHPAHGTLLILPDHGKPFIAMEQAAGDSTDFALRQMRPGSYLVMAFDSLNNLEYSDLDALEPYLAHATRVDLTSGQETSISVELIKRGGE